MNSNFKHQSIQKHFGVIIENDKVITNITDSTENISKGSIFFARQGMSSHGSDYIKLALNRGAILIISSKAINNKKVHYVPDLENILAGFLYDYYDIEQKKVKFFGITGTNGKTSIAYLAHKITQDHKKSSAYIGTLGYISENFRSKSNNTTPSIFFIFDCISQTKYSNTLYVYLELSSHGLSQRRLNNLCFEKVCICNIASDHLDYHENHEAYTKSKLSVLKLYARREPLINHEITEKNSMNVNHYSISEINENATFYVNILRSSPKRSECNIFKNKQKIFSFSTDFFPDFNILNACYSICLILDQDFFNFHKIDFKRLSLPPGRNNIFKKDQKMIVVDFAHNPNALELIISSYKSAYNSIWTLFGCGGNRDKSKRNKMFKIAKKYSQKIFITSDNSRFENFNSIVRDILGEDRFDNLEVIKDRDSAIKIAIDTLPKNVPLLILGRGHEETLSLGKNIINHSDIKAVQRYISL